MEVVTQLTCNKLVVKVRGSLEPRIFFIHRIHNFAIRLAVKMTAVVARQRAASSRLTEQSVVCQFKDHIRHEPLERFILNELLVDFRVIFEQ